MRYPPIEDHPDVLPYNIFPGDRVRVDSAVVEKVGSKWVYVRFFSGHLVRLHPSDLGFMKRGGKP